MPRSYDDVTVSPKAGDVVELSEGGCDVILRVLAVLEGYVWFKQYGKGRQTMHVDGWEKRLTLSPGKVVASAGDSFNPDALE